MYACEGKRGAIFQRVKIIHNLYGKIHNILQHDTVCRRRDNGKG